ncbi:hypothetical protein [Bergeyella cardium]|uniref:Uncharacterized protein n=1 Tax=Bergeyella cardium TaxID=1585976 RepID=A0A6P1QT78_9FLAO|nr:hypothetical protein [Bergeyella cardium]QHN64895.1 hypothetical protein DBX24_02785 [Bergeyella cardium]WHE34204.1 hypothetical protein P8603_02805 [Bergeyella cardium]WHF60855.1 hypothetical protein O0R51_02800 [Bergeyella cardium]
MEEETLFLAPLGFHWRKIAAFPAPPKPTAWGALKNNRPTSYDISVCHASG